jgi:hypothetical protein
VDCGVTRGRARVLHCIAFCVRCRFVSGWSAYRMLTGNFVWSPHSDPKVVMVHGLRGLGVVQDSEQQPTRLLLASSVAHTSTASASTWFVRSLTFVLRSLL